MSGCHIVNVFIVISEGVCRVVNVVNIQSNFEKQTLFNKFHPDLTSLEPGNEKLSTRSVFETP